MNKQFNTAVDKLKSLIADIPDTTRFESIGESIDQAQKLKDAEKQLSNLQQSISDIRMQLEVHTLRLMDDAGTTKGGGLYATGAINETEIPNVSNWDEFYRYVHRNQAFYLLERRIARTAWREREKDIPGVTKFIKRSLKTWSISTTK
jgi:hypothetical protein